jgi:uridylate kinase
VKNGLQVAIVIGGGNIFRGLQGVGKGFDRVNGDKMGMLATVINSLGLAMAIRSAGVEAEVFTATPMMPVARYYMRDDAVAVMERGGVALIAGGTGNPYFTTDSGAALRALENTNTEINDLYSLTASLPDSYRSDWVHFYTPEGTEVIGGKVLAMICEMLSISPSEINIKDFNPEKYSKSNIGY